MMKKKERRENKKRKAAALLNIIKSNEKDKKLKSQHSMESSEDESENEISIEASKTLEEPLNKKVKVEEKQEEMFRRHQNGISDEDYKQISKELVQRKNELQNTPKLRLKFFGERASMLVNPKKRQPLLFEDIQYLLLNALLGSSSPFKPTRFCVFEKAHRVTHTVVLVIEGLTSYNFMANESLFIRTKGIFEHQLEVHLPKYEPNKIIQALSCVPLTQAQKEMLIKEHGSLEAALKLSKNPNMFEKSLFPIEYDDNSDDEDLVDGETFPRTKLLLSPLQMMIEGYPMPIKGEYEERYKDYKFTKTKYKPVTTKSPLYGLDCEMCRTKSSQNELTRVSIVNEKYESIYETLVRPESQITDYLTKWSGITKEMMDNVTTTLKDVQRDVCRLLPPDAILVGQSLNCDLNAMKLMHPYVIDTSIIFNLSGDRNRKSKLQLLAKQFLDEEIQTDHKGHSSIEDSTACLKLTKLKLSKDIYFGDVALQQRREVIEAKSTTFSGIVKDESAPSVKTPMFTQALKRQKKSAIITTNQCNVDLSNFNSSNQFDILRPKSPEGSPQELKHGIIHHQEKTARRVIKKTRQIAIEHDFNISHFNVFEDLLDKYTYEELKHMDDDQKIASVVPKLDRWIEKVWSSVATNGLFVVLFGGRDANTNGLSMFQIKS